MDINIETYKKFIKQNYNEIKYSSMIPKKIKKSLKSFKKQINKLDSETFTFLINLNYQYILSSIMADDNNDSFLNYSKNKIFETDDEDSNYNSKIHFKIINDSDFEINKNGELIFPPELKNINWAMKGAMELTIASNGTMWMNNELWKYLNSMNQINGYKNIIKVFQQNQQKPPSEISVHIGYDKNHLLISLSKQLSRCMEITFNENFDSYGEPYGTVDDDVCLKFQIESSFNVKGKYRFKPTNVFGLLYGEKVQ